MRRGTLLVAILAMLAVAGQMPDWWTTRDSLRHLPPNMRYHARRVEPGPDLARPDSVTLKLVGKWGGGPSNKVTGRGTLLYLSRGSQVVAIDFSNAANPRVLSTIEADGVVERSVLVGNVLYVGAVGIEAYDVSDSTRPTRLGQTFRFTLGDMDVVGTYAYTCARDSFRVFDFSDPEHPQQTGVCADSGYSLSVCNGFAYVGYRWGLYIIDVQDPANPQRAGSWGTDILSVRARNNICCVTMGELTFRILDISNPAVPVPIGMIDNCGGFDMYLDGPLAFMSGYYTGGHVFRILDISDSTHPSIIGATGTPAEQHWGVWANMAEDRAFVADGVCGLTSIDVSNLNSPVVDSTRILAAGHALDIGIDGHLAYVASDLFGMIILDVSTPGRIAELGHVDSTRDMVTYSVVGRDSFAFMGHAPGQPRLRSIDVSDPTNPTKAGGASLFDWPEDMVLHDSFLFIAEAYRFQVVNVARPREPVLVGSCDETGISLWLEDTLMYVGSSRPKVVSVADPTDPVVVGQFGHPAWNLVVSDTVAFLSAGPLVWYDVADPTAPTVVDSIALNHTARGLAVVDTIAYVSALDQLHAVNVSDLHRPQIVATASLPYTANRIIYAEPYLYLSCSDAGVSIYETVSTGLREPGDGRRLGGRLWAVPNPSVGRVALMTKAMADCVITVRDAAGRAVRVMPVRGVANGRVVVKLNRLPPGIYFAEVGAGEESAVAKLVVE